MEHAHRGSLLGCAFGADADRIWTAGVEGGLVAWHRPHGDLVHRIAAHRGPVNAMAQLPSRNEIASAGHDGTVQVRSADSGALRLRLAGHVGGVLSVAVDASATLLASGGFDTEILLWDLRDGVCIGKFRGHSGAVNSLDFDAQGRLYSASRDGSVRVWQIADRSCLAVLLGHSRWPTGVRAFGDDEHLISVGEDGHLRCWRASDGEPCWHYALPHTPPVWGFAWDAARTFALIGAGGALLRCAVDVSGVRRSERIDRETARAIALHADGSAALGTDNGQLCVLPSGVGRFSERHATASVSALSIAAIGRGAQAICSVGMTDGGVCVHTKDAPSFAAPSHERFVYVARRVDSTRIATAAFDGVVLLRNARGDVLQRLPHGGLVFALDVSADGAMLLSAGSGRIARWRALDGAACGDIDVAGLGMHAMACFGKHTDEIVSVGENGDLLQFRLEPGAAAFCCTSRRHVHDHPLTGIARLPTADQYVLSSANGDVLLVDLARDASTLLHAAHEDWIRGLHASADGRYVLSVSQHGIACLYDLVRGALVTPPELQTRVVPAACFAEDDAICYVDGRGEVRVLAPPGASAMHRLSQ